MHGHATAPGAGTVVNALATGRGAAFAIDLTTSAAVDLDPDCDDVTGTIADEPSANTDLIERCVELVTEQYGNSEGGTVRTESDLPVAAGLKSSSAAANAAVLATLDALDRQLVDDAAPGNTSPLDELTTGGAGEASGQGVGRVEACRVGVQAAREAGVTVTGAFDDASASMLGGVTVTDNEADELLAREPFEKTALVWTPPQQAHSADADVDACRQVSPMAELAMDLALAGAYGQAMSVNGLAFCAALEYPTGPLVEAMPHAEGVSLSGTGPSVVAIGDRTALDPIQERWEHRDGTTRRLQTRTDGARIT